MGTNVGDPRHPNFNWGYVRNDLMKVDPILASEWLERNEKNRRIKQANLDSIVADLVAGRWRHTGAPIQFDRNGKLLDGQHRLRAIVLSGVTVEIYVAFGLEPEARAVIDVGAGRTVADQAYMRDIPHGKPYGSAVSLVIQSENSGIRSALNESAIKPGKPEITERLLDDFTGDQRIFSCIDATRAIQNLGIGWGLRAFLLLQFRRVDQEQADAFFTALRDGVGLERTDPRLLLRERLMAHAIGAKTKLVRREMLAVFVKSWNYFITGKPMNLLRFQRNEDFPRIQNKHGQYLDHR